MIPHTDKPLHQQILFRLFQASVWRRYVLDWDSKPGGYGHSRRWLIEVGRHDRANLMRRARINIRLAQRLRRRKERGDVS